MDLIRINSGGRCNSLRRELSDDFRNGFIDSLRLETVDETRMAAARADRTNANYTVFQSGVYTACEPCKDDPKKPPLWQVKAVRIIHDEAEKMMYFEDARIEFFGVPLAYMPYFSAPDPSVKRKSGFLMPVITTSSAYGLGMTAASRCHTSGSGTPAGSGISKTLSVIDTSM